jgi:hypothetical protein
MRITLIPLLFLQMTPVASKTQEVVMQVDADHVVNYVVADPAGRMTGIDPRGAARREDWKRYQEIPQSNYAFMSVGDLDPNASVEVSTEFICHFDSPGGDGTYAFQFFGNKLGKFNLYVTAGGYDTTHIQRVRFDVKNIPIDRDSVITYRFTYHGRPGSNVSFVKVVNANSLLQDVSAMLKLNWMPMQSTADDYSELFRSYASQFEQNNIKAARSTLEGVLANLKADSGITLTADAYNSLSLDTKQLIAELPSVTAMLDTLVSYKHRSFALGLLGDDSFEKELDNGLENAQKHLAKRDSINARKEIQTFQEKVDEEYEKTSNDQKKGKARDKRYVAESGWTLLHLNAQHIIDRLPEEKKGKK